MSGFGVVRTIVIAIGFLMVLGGFAAIAAGGSGLAAFGFWNVVIGLVIIAALLLERRRYRSEPADRAGQPPGPAGGEPHGTVLDPRFQATEEQFDDPTTRQRMRVWLDPRTGERRYLPEE